jgi:mercuric ion binding protein
MKTLRIFSLITLFLAIADLSFAQKIKTETFKVSGECGMCKKKIEKAAKEAGATSAVWNTQTKALKVTYSVTATSVSSIQQKIAGVGYDTPQYKATEDAYNGLDACCQYDRQTVKKEMSCCVAGCEMKDGKCKDEATCKTKGCCKDSAACKEKGCCSPEKISASH